MNYNTLSGSAKMYKKLGVYTTGQTVASGEIANIAIITTLNAFDHKRLVESVGFGVRACGGTVNVFYTPFFGFSNKINPMTAKYADNFRKVAASNAEAIIKTNLIDGVVAVTDCEITAIAIIEGAARSNCPVLILPTGVSEQVSKDKEIFKTLGQLAAGKINAKQSEKLIQDAVIHKGISNDFGSTSTFFILAEAMGLSVPGASLGQIDSGEHFRTAVRTGEQICKNAKDLLAPKKFLTRGALNNAVILCLAIGGEIGALNLLINLVKVYEPKIPYELIADYSPKTSLLLSIENQNCIDLSKRGVFSVLKQLAATPKFIDENTLTFSGEKLRAVLSETENAGLVPVSKSARVVLVKGSAAELGGYVQPTDTTPAIFSGKAWVYDGLEAADKAVLSGNLPSGSIIVVHNCKNTYISALAFSIEGMQRQNEIAIITDGLCEKTSCLVVTNCTPDSFENEGFANIQNGDALEIDLSKGRLNTSILAKEQKVRAKRNSVKKTSFYF